MKQMEVNTREAAYLCDCSPDDLVAAAHHGGIAARKVGRRWRFTLRAVREWAKRQGKGKK